MFQTKPCFATKIISRTFFHKIVLQKIVLHKIVLQKMHTQAVDSLIDGFSQNVIHKTVLHITPELKRFPANCSLQLHTRKTVPHTTFLTKRFLTKRNTLCPPPPPHPNENRVRNDVTSVYNRITIKNIIYFLLINIVRLNSLIISIIILLYSPI